MSQANGAQFVNNILLDTGQCGIGIADGTNQVVDSNRVLNRTPVQGGGNTAIYVWKQYSSACGPVTVLNNIATETNTSGAQSGFWNGGGCEPVTLTSEYFRCRGADAVRITESGRCRRPGFRRRPRTA